MLIVGLWSGTLEQFSHDRAEILPVELSIDTVIGNEFSGEMSWPTLDGCRTRVDGLHDGNIVKWMETDYIEGDAAVLYGLYVAQLRGADQLDGDWMDPRHTIQPSGPNYGVPGARFRLRRK